MDVATVAGAPAAARRPSTLAVVTTLCGLSVVTAGARLVLLVQVAGLPDVNETIPPFDLVSPLLTPALAVIGALVVVRGDAPRYGWLLLATGVAAGLVGVAGLYTLLSVSWDGPSLPLQAFAGWTQDLWMVTWMLAFLLLPGLFPDGKATPPWRRPLRAAAAVWILLVVVFVLEVRPMTNYLLDLNAPPANPTGVLPIPHAVVVVVWLGVSAASVAIGAGSLVSRWRTADGELRQRMKWVLYALGVVLAVFAADIGSQAVEGVVGVDLGLHWTLSLLTALAMLVLVVALGFAVLRFRLYDVDLVINRTLVYSSLTTLTVVTYVGVVVGVGTVLPVDELVLSLAATGLVAVVFAPARDRLQRTVNRLMFGDRDDPYRMLSELGRVLARSADPRTTLWTVAETVATGMRLPGAAIELEHDGEWQGGVEHGTLPRHGGVVVPLRHQGQLVGRLVVAPRSSHETLSPKDRALLEDVAHQVGALVHSVRLTMALQRSRERLVLAREEERRRIRRDLHDGLGPSLASQTFAFDAVLEHLPADAGAAAALVTSLKGQTQQLVADIRRLVHELRPPALDDLGLAGALEAQAGHLGRSGRPDIRVQTDPDPLPELPAAVEVAAYRIVREAVANVVRHAGAKACAARLEASATQLRIDVTDDGTGIDVPSDNPGIGLASMRERAEELGGTFQVAPARPRGTRVTATLPLVGSHDG